MRLHIYNACTFAYGVGYLYSVVGVVLLAMHDHRQGFARYARKSRATLIFIHHTVAPYGRCTVPAKKAPSTNFALVTQALNTGLLWVPHCL